MKLKELQKMIDDMSLEEKAAQMTQQNAVCLKADSLAEITGSNPIIKMSESQMYQIGSVLNFWNADEAKEIQEDYLAKSQRKIPLMFMLDVVHGYKTIFPIPLALGATFDESIIEECARMSAIEAKYDGVQVTFAPMVDLVRDSRWGRVMESTGEDPYLNGKFGRAFIRGYQSGGLACCVKHFAAYGAVEAGRDYNTTDLSPMTLYQYYLQAYGECIKEKPELVMSSFNLLNGVPVNAHTDLLIDVLRKKWKFDGILISDFQAIWEMITHGYAEDEKQCACIALNNEIDVEMVSTTYLNWLPELVAEGKVSQKKVDKMLSRVLKLKNKLGLFENPYYQTDFEKAKEVFLCDEHRKIARNAAEKSFVLLKNDGALPISKTEKIAVVGPFATEKDIIGAWAAKGDPKDAVTVLEGFENLLGRQIPTASGCSGELLSTDESGIKSAVKAAKKAKVVVACIGERSFDSGESMSRADIAVPAVQISLLKALKKAGKKVVSVVFGGRAQVLTEVEKYSDAILYVWQPGTEGGNAIARVVFGEVNPSGKTTITFPRATGQCPIYYNVYNTSRPKLADTLTGNQYRSQYIDVLNAPLYPFGYGLSYTKFELSSLRLSSKKMDEKGEIDVFVKVKNVGDRAGEEVVQLYVRDMFASIVRPVKELKDYQKIHLEPNEEKEVEFTLTEEQLRFYNANFEQVSEPGEFRVMVGNNSRDCLEDTFTLVK